MYGVKLNSRCFIQDGVISIIFTEVTLKLYCVEVVDICYNIRHLRVNSLVHVTFFITSKMSGFERTKQHMREALLWSFNLKKKGLLKITACFRKRMVNMLDLRQRVEIGLDGLKVAISIFKTKNVQDSRKIWTLRVWRHDSMKIAVRLLNNCLTD